MPRPPLACESVWSALGRTLLTTVRRSNYAASANRLQQLVDGRYVCSSADRALIQTTVERLYATQGQVRMRELAAHCCLSLRQFERRFQQVAGIAPKTLARLIRFESARDLLIQNPSLRLIDLAYMFGYADQSHFIRDFKAIAACTPSQFVARMIQRSMTHFYYLPDPRPSYTASIFT